MKQFIFSLLLTVAFTQTMQAQEISAEEKIILMELYNNTGGANWSNKTNWGTAVYPWYGVTVDPASGKVTQIDLHNNNLVGGPLPSDLNQLTNLQKFWAYDNQLTGSIPALTGLSNLQSFYVSNNQLMGSIPALTGLSNLKEFYVFKNNLSGSLPSFTGLTSLYSFQAYNNKLNGSIPSLTPLTNLQYFYVQNNQLSGPIPSLSSLTNLVIFLAFNNQLSGSIPSLSGLTKLQNFEVSNNLLDGNIPALTGLTSLKDFTVNNNQLTGNIPDLTELTSLQDFIAYNNQLSGPIPAFTGLSNLQNFGVYNNKLTGSIPSLAGLNNLLEFTADNNQLSGALPPLAGLTNLQYFYVYNNQLTGSIPSLAGLNNLQEFFANNNQFSGLTPFVKPANLIYFYIYNNNINFTAFDNITDAALKAFLTTAGNQAFTAPQTVAVTIAKSGNTISTNLAEGATPGNYTYHWYKGTPGSGTLLTNISGSNSITTDALATAGAATTDNIYVTVTHNTYTISSGATKNLTLTSNTLNTALPVSFGSINTYIKNGQLFVKWSTENESNCSHYDVQVSANGKDWKTIKTLQSKATNGNSSQKLDYEYIAPISSVTLGVSLLFFLMMSLPQHDNKSKKYTAKKNLRGWVIAILLILSASSLFTACKKQDALMNPYKNEKVLIRIAQVDNDGTVQYSKVMMVVRE